MTNGKHLKDGDLLLQRLREKANRRKRLYLRYLLACPKHGEDVLTPYHLACGEQSRTNGTEEILFTLSVIEGRNLN